MQWDTPSPWTRSHIRDNSGTTLFRSAIWVWISLRELAFSFYEPNVRRLIKWSLDLEKMFFFLDCIFFRGFFSPGVSLLKSHWGILCYLIRWAKFVLLLTIISAVTVSDILLVLALKLKSIPLPHTYMVHFTYRWSCKRGKRTGLCLAAYEITPGSRAEDPIIGRNRRILELELSYD